ncbi:hypothetical protein ACFXTO_035964 [Malus domestica]
MKRTEIDLEEQVVVWIRTAVTRKRSGNVSIQTEAKKQRWRRKAASEPRLRKGILVFSLYPHKINERKERLKRTNPSFHRASEQLLGRKGPKEDRQGKAFPNLLLVPSVVNRFHVAAEHQNGGREPSSYIRFSLGISIEFSIFLVSGPSTKSVTITPVLTRLFLATVWNADGTGRDGTGRDGMEQDRIDDEEEVERKISQISSHGTTRSTIFRHTKRGTERLVPFRPVPSHVPNGT